MAFSRFRTLFCILTVAQLHTDADILGARFPYRAELFVNPMRDEEIFTRVSDVPYIVIVEVKQGRCSLNDAWTNPELNNVQRVLRSIGILPLANIDVVASHIYDQGYYRDSSSCVSLFCIGEEINDEVHGRYANIPQVTWDAALRFIFNRFSLINS
jgi:hypothetical protein